MNLSNFFHNADTTRPVLVVPKLSEIDACRADLRTKIAAQLDTAARQLANNNFWKRDRRMIRPTIERWSEQQLQFVGLDLTDFCRAIELEYNVQTEDGQSWRLDRVIGDRLWAAAIRPGVLPIADWNIELAKRKEAEQRKETTNARRK
jgi:hypothetical protein